MLSNFLQNFAQVIVIIFRMLDTFLYNDTQLKIKVAANAFSQIINTDTLQNYL